MRNLVIFLAFILALGCSSVEEEFSPLTQNPVAIHIVGKKNNHACYWKNNQELLLANGEGASADTIMVANNDVHILGKKTFDNWTYQYLYWKNNIFTNLSETLTTPDQSLKAITGMDVEGSDIYFVGYTKNPLITAEIYEFSYWKNGVKTVLAITNNYFQAKIKVVGNDVFILGPTSNCFDNCQGIYKNGLFSTVTTFNINLEDFAVKNGEIYVYGNNFSTNEGFFKNLSTNSETILPQNIRKMVFEADDMYVLTSDAILKNGTVMPTNAMPSNGMTNFTSFIRDFKVLNENIYYISSGNPLNDLPFSLVGINNTTVFESLDNVAIFNGIFVTEN